MSTEQHKIVICDGFTYIVNEIPMTAEWPAGDPLERDSETLVTFKTRPTLAQQEKKMKDELVQKIIRIIRLEGDDTSDGEAIDMIVELLEDEGYVVIVDVPNSAQDSL